MEKTKILHCLNSISTGGAETFIMNLYRHVNTDKLQFDFMVRRKTENKYTKEIEALGGIIYVMPEFPRRFLKNQSAVKRFFRENNDYKVIHVHANSLLYIYPLYAAKKRHINVRIIHSHNTMSANKFYRPIHCLNKIFLNSFATDMWACSAKAGKWMFGERNFKVINNSIDALLYRFDEVIRERVRSDLDINDKLVLGNIGRFELQKNHKFLVEIFKDYYNKDKNSVLLLIGEGSLKDEIENDVEKAGIKEAVLFLGVRNDIPDLLKAMDYFLMPSFYEGLPFALIEAEAAGCKCIIADNITDEAVITENVVRLPINEGTNCWLKEIDSTSKWQRDTYKEICDNGFDIISISKEISGYYLK